MLQGKPILRAIHLYGGLIGSTHKADGNDGPISSTAWMAYPASLVFMHFGMADLARDGWLNVAGVCRRDAIRSG
jgi:hypothetical protein